MATRPAHYRETKIAPIKAVAERVATVPAQALAWVLADHDDRIPSRIQTAVWFLALLALFVSTGGAR